MPVLLVLRWRFWYCLYCGYYRCYWSNTCYRYYYRNRSRYRYQYNYWYWW